MRLKKYINEAKEFKAVVKDKRSKEISIVTSTANSKKEFISDLKQNGYIVDPKKVKQSKDFDYIMNRTNAEDWDWLGISQEEYLNRKIGKIRK